MSEEEILRELRAIRILLTIDNRDEIGGMLDRTSAIQYEILGSLDDTDWAGIDTSGIAKKYEVDERTVRDHRAELESWGFVEKQGEKRWAEYRKTVIAEAAELLF